MKNILLEAILVVAAGAILALAANALSPRGLALARDYFQQAPPPGNPPTVSSNSTAHLSERQLLEARLRQKGLQLAEKDLVHRLFQDVKFQQGTVVFLDARDDQHYQEGHIPGAYQLDYYRPANYLATVLPACQSAEEIVVYCNGGNCEDSELAATFLRDAGIPGQKLMVYAGGMSEWSTNGWPVETGQRNSGVLRETKR